MERIFGAPRALIGVAHLAPLPGTPRAGLSVDEIAERAVRDAEVYAGSGFDAVLLENMGDRPYLKRGVGPEIVAAATAAGRAIREAVDLPLGVQLLAGANREALAVALAVGAAFVRVEGFVFGHVADEGWMDADAGALLRYRETIGAGHLAVIADIKKKHSSHAATADVDLAETARAAEFFLADGVVVTGRATAEPTAPAEVDAVAAAVGIPVLVGSGVTPDRIAGLSRASGLIVGSYAKTGGVWSDPVDPERAGELVAAFARAHATA